MNKKYTFFLYSMFFVGAIFIFYVYLFGHDEKRGRTNATLITEVLPFEEEQQSETTRVLTFRYEDFPLGGNCLAFHTVHQSIEVYLENSLVYSVKPVPSVFGRSTGTRWNFINIPPDTQYITVVLTGIYPSTYDREVSFSYGTGIVIYESLLRESILPAMLSLFNFLIGLMILFYWFATNRKKGSSNVLLYLGIFSAVMGIWSFGETTLSDLVVTNHVACGTSAFILLALAPIPFLLFLRELLKIEDKWVWKVITLYCFTTFLIEIVLQLIGVADMKETVFLTHIGIIMLGVYTVISMGIKISKCGFTHIIKVHSFGLLFIILSIVLDLTTYNTATVKVDTFGRFGFFIYIVIMAIDTSRGTAKRIEEGRKADYYRELAKKDMLTGLLNRNAYIADCNALESNENILLFTFDLNDLKKTNDLYGHCAGDKYLQNSSTIISGVFQPYGTCYRIGGDEFSVIIQNGWKCNPEELKNLLIARAEQYKKNLSSGNIKIKIAQGYAYFDPNKDKDLEDTMRRADAAMYAEKAQMKEDGM